MQVLRQVRPTREQLKVIDRQSPGVLVIRGAAGSGKTTTALYRLKQTVRFWQRRVRDGHLQGPVRVLVLTYNRTLRGYIEELARHDITGNDVELTVSTFAKWAWDHVGSTLDPIPFDSIRGGEIRRLGAGLSLPGEFLISEVDYLLGRFEPTKLDEYVDCERVGRGRSPRVSAATRRRILDEIIAPYQAWKAQQSASDWSDLATAMAAGDHGSRYHVVVVDEAQDFSANQVRAVVAHLHDQHSLTFVLDGAQRIYPQRFTWAETGLAVPGANSQLLSENHRNTKQIAAFAAPLLSQVEVTDDASMPDFASCQRDGELPTLVHGKFSAQMDHLVAFLGSLDPEAQESVAILHAKGWFNEVESRLNAAGMAYVTLTRKADWPAGPENIALSTMHSVKGLEFDHVIIVGLNAETMPHDAEPGDSERDAHLRLLAMAAGRARKSLTVTFKPSEASDLVDCLDPATYQVVDV